MLVSQNPSYLLNARTRAGVDNPIHATKTKFGFQLEIRALSLYIYRERERQREMCMCIYIHTLWEAHSAKKKKIYIYIYTYIIFYVHTCMDASLAKPLLLFKRPHMGRCGQYNPCNKNKDWFPIIN